MSPNYPKHKDFEYKFKYAGRYVGLVILAGCLFVLVALAFEILAWSVILMAVWNWLLVPAFHLTTIDWLQAFAVAVVFSIIQSTLVGIRGRD